MRKYYLVAEEDLNGKYTVFVTDAPQRREVLKEIEANSYADAVKMYGFRVRSNGKGAYCGVDVNGNHYHG